MEPLWCEDAQRCADGVVVRNNEVTLTTFVPIAAMRNHVVATIQSPDCLSNLRARYRGRMAKKKWGGGL